MVISPPRTEPERTRPTKRGRRWSTVPASDGRLVRRLFFRMDGRPSELGMGELGEAAKLST